MPSTQAVAEGLAVAILAGPIEEEPLVERMSRLLGRRWRWLRPLTRRVLAEHGEPPRPPIARLVSFLLADAGLRRAMALYQLSLAEPLTEERPPMRPAPPALAWGVPAIRDPGELAAWFGLTAGELSRFADPKGFERKRSTGRLRNYRYRVLTKKGGSPRLIEAPKPQLKALQRQVHDRILAHIPPDDAAHGFRRGRSIETFAMPHVGRPVVLRMDLCDFFPSVAMARVAALFRLVGYPDAVAGLLAALGSNATPEDVWPCDLGVGVPGAREARRRYSVPHLPQGAPTSPTLANLIAYRMDRRLGALAATAGAVYTRYADDLAFSGGEAFARSVGRFRTHATAVVMEEGFLVNHRKTRVMRRGGGQRLAGLVLSDRLGTPREDRDRLRAILHNCQRYGPASQNRAGHADWRGHLNGRVAFVEMVNPEQGRRLRAAYERIVW